MSIILCVHNYFSCKILSDSYIIKETKEKTNE